MHLINLYGSWEKSTCQGGGKPFFGNGFLVLDERRGLYKIGEGSGMEGGLQVVWKNEL
jgi:hypothetical protein